MTASIRDLDTSSRFGREAEIRKLYNECWEFSYRNWQQFLASATDDLSFYLGNQWSASDLSYLKEQRREALVFNKIRRNVKMVTGYERRVRHSYVAQAVESSDEMTADQLTKIMLYVRNKEMFSHTESEAFEAILKTAMNLLVLSLDFSSDAEGDIKLYRVPYNAYLLDPRFTKRDLSDCGYICQRRLISRDEAKSLIPWKADHIDDIPLTDNDEKYTYMQTFGNTFDKEVMRYDEFWVKNTKKMKIFMDRETGERITVPISKVSREIEGQFLREFPSWFVRVQSLPTVEQNILVNDNLIFTAEDPLRIGDYPHTLCAAFWDPEYSDQDGNDGFALKMQSMVRCMKDGQIEENKIRSMMVDYLRSKQNTGWIAKSDTVINEQDLYRTGQGRVIFLNKNAQMTDLQPIIGSDIPQGVFTLRELNRNDIQDIAGISDEMLGQPDTSTGISGQTVKLRQDAGITVMQDLLDNFRYSQKLVAKKLLKLVQNYSPEKIRRILREEPTEEFFNKNFGKYDVSVEESVETPSQKALAYHQILQAAQLGVIDMDIAKELALEYMPIQGKDKIIERMRKREELAQEAAKSQMEQEQLTRQLAQAKMFGDIGMGVERMARAEADRGLARERISEMQENQSQAVLARVKAIKELENMELSQLTQLLQLAKALEDTQVSQGEVKAQEIQQETGGQVGQAVEFATQKPPVQPV